MLPWADMFRQAVAMGLSPQDFWACSVREWRWLSGGHESGLVRQHLNELIRQFPDKEEVPSNGTV
ncbi:phage tail assembly chaperone [Henriciella mobilis]|uniref:phage tail assembly chaperone n=1 Tax=Henriciella mobilis TaxID=2305467 RepID=UPI000E65F53B|nr:phage tail assembly chaperone [Henriciella mobilis]RIJ14439.1 phage tail assembly chaperone [Henriciella mobilis]RIJ19733.1 phage tail assembly chaperone [Henriciella mobilis]